MKSSNKNDLQKIRSIANYQFGLGVGKTLFPDDVEIIHSPNTGKIRYILLKNELLATLQPKTGQFILTIRGARIMLDKVRPLKLWVKIKELAEPFVTKGRSLFAKHVISADLDIRPNEEVIVINKKNELVAVGRAILTGKEMLVFEKGIAVKIRKGVAEKK